MTSPTAQSLTEFLQEHSNDVESTAPSSTPPPPLSPTFFFPEDLPRPSDDLPPAYTSITPPPPYATHSPLALPILLQQYKPSHFLPVGLATPTTNKLHARTRLSSAEVILRLPRNSTYRQLIFLLNGLAKAQAGVRAPSLTHRFFHRILVEKRNERGTMAEVEFVDSGVWPGIRGEVESGNGRLRFLFAMVERTWRGESAWRTWVREPREEMSTSTRDSRWGVCLVEEVVRRSERNRKTF